MQIIAFMKGHTQKNMLVGILLTLSLASGCAKSGGVLGGEGSASPTTLSNQLENYGDIEMPLEMQLVPSETMGLDTDSFQGGVYRYEGRVDLASLVEYVTVSMRNNKWKLMGEAHYDSKRMLAYTKPNRTCMIVLLPGGVLGKATATFYITVDVAAASRLNPFGEPVQ